MQNRRKVNLPKEYKVKHWNCFFKDVSPEGEKSDRGQGCNPNILHLDVLSLCVCVSFHFIPQRERT